MKLPQPFIKPPSRGLYSSEDKLKVQKLKLKNKKLYCLLYIPTGEYIKLSDNDNDIIIPRNYSISEFVYHINASRREHYTIKMIDRNQIILPTIEEHFEKVEFPY